MQQEKEAKEQLERLQAAKRQLEKNKEDNVQDENDNVKWPKYTYDEYFRMDIERDEDKPDTTLFMEVGYDPIRV